MVYLCRCLTTQKTLAPVFASIAICLAIAYYLPTISTYGDLHCVRVFDDIVVYESTVVWGRAASRLWIERQSTYGVVTGTVQYVPPVMGVVLTGRGHVYVNTFDVANSQPMYQTFDTATQKLGAATHGLAVGLCSNNRYLLVYSSQTKQLSLVSIANGEIHDSLFIDFTPNVSHIVQSDKLLIAEDDDWFIKAEVVDDKLRYRSVSVSAAELDTLLHSLANYDHSTGRISSRDHFLRKRTDQLVKSMLCFIVYLLYMAISMVLVAVSGVNRCSLALLTMWAANVFLFSQVAFHGSLYDPTLVLLAIALLPGHNECRFVALSIQIAIGSWIAMELNFGGSGRILPGLTCASAFVTVVFFDLFVSWTRGVRLRLKNLMDMMACFAIVYIAIIDAPWVTATREALWYILLGVIFATHIQLFVHEAFGNAMRVYALAILLSVGIFHSSWTVGQNCAIGNAVWLIALVRALMHLTIKK